MTAATSDEPAFAVPIEWPPILQHACTDSWCFRAHLISGEVVMFESASAGDFSPEWVHLSGSQVFPSGRPSLSKNLTEGRYALPLDLERGLDVRVEHIKYLWEMST